MLNRVLVHAGRKALAQSTCTALIAMRLINRTLAVHFALRFAGVHSIPMYGALEEAGAAILFEERKNEESFGKIK